MQKPGRIPLGKCQIQNYQYILQYTEQSHKAKQQKLPRKQNEGQKSNILKLFLYYSD